MNIVCPFHTYPEIWLCYISNQQSLHVALAGFEHHNFFFPIDAQPRENFSIYGVLPRGSRKIKQPML